MSDFESNLRAMIADLVRDEVRRAVADATRADEYLSTRAAAELAQVAQGTIRRWIRARRLSRCSTGRVLRVSRIELEALLRSGSAENDATPEDLAARMFG